jgi:NAD(P)-dependent dehydrogenase (short-subunit alcohol dehydrogenase family)
LDPLPLSGRAALVTGVSRRAGIGFAISRRLLGLGAKVFVQSWVPYDKTTSWGADPGGLDAVLSELSALGECGHIAADFADPEAPASVLAAAGAAFGHVDILVANHARSEPGSLEAVTAAQLDAHLAENVRASVLLVKEFAAQHDGRVGGRVILMTSGQQLAPMGEELAYAVSKGALVAATLSLSDDLIERGITVNAVNPGPTDTGWGLAEADPYPAMPLRRWGEPDDAARLIAWLCTDDAAWITGQVIDSEGGFRRWAS